MVGFYILGALSHFLVPHGVSGSSYRFPPKVLESPISPGSPSSLYWSKGFESKIWVVSSVLGISGGDRGRVSAFTLPKLRVKENKCEYIHPYKYAYL